MINAASVVASNILRLLNLSKLTTLNKYYSYHIFLPFESPNLRLFSMGHYFQSKMNTSEICFFDKCQCFKAYPRIDPKVNPFIICLWNATIRIITGNSAMVMPAAKYPHSILYKEMN